MKVISRMKEFSEDFFEHRPDHHIERDEDLDALDPDYEKDLIKNHPTLPERL